MYGHSGAMVFSSGLLDLGVEDFYDYERRQVYTLRSGIDFDWKDAMVNYE